MQLTLAMNAHQNDSTARAQLSDAIKLLDDFEWATKEAKLCPNRIWAVAGKDLHKVLPSRRRLDECIEFIEKSTQAILEEVQLIRPANEISVDAESHHGCTFDFCQHSVRDYTWVHQRHECRLQNCSRLKGLFSRSTLTKAAIDGKSTVWSLDGHSMIDQSRPYMAISHVWSDGTGAGQWPHGEVNECLYRYFKGIAVQFRCEGIWWDSICIPSERAASAKAIKKIHTNYESAHITLVHDCFLRNWKWDRETACFAILISPWFSRGWTALELAKSYKVKVVFQGPVGPVFKDLDEEILAKPGDNSRLQEASKIIRRLREGVNSINGLLKILRPRDTSWPRDRPIISALLAGIRIPPSGEQQSIYKRILTDIDQPLISHGQIFHNSSTTSEGSWCPSNLFNLPAIDEPERVSTEDQLRIEKDLSLVGTWNRISAKEFADEKTYDWRGTHSFLREKLEHHLRREWGSEKCTSFLLFEVVGSADRAILVKETRQEKDPNISQCYKYVGAVFFRQAQNLEKGQVKEVRILGDADSPDIAIEDQIPKDS